jgi:Tfp pilus assembly protein FimT
VGGPGRCSGWRLTGYSFAEVLVVAAIVSVLMATSAPFFTSYYQSARLRSAAGEIAGFLNQGRQIAIRQNDSVCVRVETTAMRLHLDSCSGATVVGPGTDAAGNVAAPQGIALAATADPVFSYLGNAAPAASIAVTNTETGSSLTVTVSASGRITIGP